MDYRIVIGLALAGLTTACSTATTAPPIEPETVVSERCHSMDYQEAYRSQYIMREGGPRHYFTYDCDSNNGDVVGSASDANKEGEDLQYQYPAWLDVQESLSDADSKSIALNDQAQENNRTPKGELSDTNEVIPPDCIHDKMSAGTPGLEPCPIEE